MAGRYRREDPIPRKAQKNNLWIRYNKLWCTPEEFYQRFGDGDSCKQDQLALLNPLPYLYVGRAVIQGMIRDKASPATIINALDRLHAFEDKLRKYQYQEQPGQLSSMPVSEEKEAPAPLERWAHLRRPQPGEYDGIDEQP